MFIKATDGEPRQLQPSDIAASALLRGIEQSAGDQGATVDIPFDNFTLNTWLERDQPRAILWGDYAAAFEVRSADAHVPHALAQHACSSAAERSLEKTVVVAFARFWHFCKEPKVCSLKSRGCILRHEHAVRSTDLGQLAPICGASLTGVHVSVKRVSL